MHPLQIALNNAFRWLTFRKPLIYLHYGPDCNMSQFHNFARAMAQAFPEREVRYATEADEGIPKQFVVLTTTWGNQKTLEPIN